MIYFFDVIFYINSSCKYGFSVFFQKSFISLLDSRKWNPSKNFLRTLKELQRWCIIFPGTFKFLATIWIPSNILGKTGFHVNSLQEPEKECINLKNLGTNQFAHKILARKILSFEVLWRNLYGLWRIFRGISPMQRSLQGSLHNSQSRLRMFEFWLLENFICFDRIYLPVLAGSSESFQDSHLQKKQEI